MLLTHQQLLGHCWLWPANDDAWENKCHPSKTSPPAQTRLNFSLFPWLCPWRGLGMQGSLPRVRKANLVSDQCQQAPEEREIAPHPMKRTPCMVFYPCSPWNLLACGREHRPKPGGHQQLVQHNFLLQTPRWIWNTARHRLTQVTVWNKSAWSNTDHVEDLQVITHNDYSERQLASKPSSLSSSPNLSPSLFLSLPGAFKWQRVSEDCFPPVVSHQKSAQEQGMVGPQWNTSRRQGAERAGHVQLCPSSSSWKLASGWGGKAQRKTHGQTNCECISVLSCWHN